MKRIFTTLAVLDTLALLASLVAGVCSKLGNGLHNLQNPIFPIHFQLGLFTAIGTLFVHCLIFTYFLGTGRWVKEVGLAYHLPDAVLPRQTRDLKRSTFPPALLAMLITIAAAAAGAGAMWRRWPWQVHGSLALAALIVNGWAFVLEYHNVTSNGFVMEQVLREVDRIRQERGLPSNEQALEQQSQ